MQLFYENEMLCDNMKIKNVKKEVSLEKAIFCGGMLISIAAFLVAAVQTRGVVLQNLFFGNPRDTFMDFFNVVICGKMPYTMQMIYPPLCHAILSFVGYFMPAALLKDGGFAVRESQIGMGVFFGWMMILLYVFFRVFRKMYCSSLRDSENHFVTDIVLFCVLFSAPFIFCFERGNIIFLALICLMIYIQWYQSENILLRLIAFTALAVSAGIKVYPAILGLLLIREKKWKQASLLVVMGAVVFFSPFLLMVGENRSVFKLLSNIEYTTGLYSTIGYGFRHDLVNQFNILSTLLNRDLTAVGSAVSLAIGLYGILLIFAEKDMERWKVLAILISLMVLLTGFNYTYSLIYLVIPLIYFMNDRSEDCRFVRIVYAVLFVLIFMPVIVYSGKDILDPAYNGSWPLRIPAVIENCALILLLLTIFVSETIRLIHGFTSKKRNK